jgi:hypothetical protein
MLLVSIVQRSGACPCQGADSGSFASTHNPAYNRAAGRSYPHSLGRLYVPPVLVIAALRTVVMPLRLVCGRGARNNRSKQQPAGNYRRQKSLPHSLLPGCRCTCHAEPDRPNAGQYKLR